MGATVFNILESRKKSRKSRSKIEICATPYQVHAIKSQLGYCDVRNEFYALKLAGKTFDFVKRSHFCSILWLYCDFDLLYNPPLKIITRGQSHRGPPMVGIIYGLICLQNNVKY